MIKNNLFLFISGIAFLLCMNLQILSAEDKTEVRSEKETYNKVKKYFPDSIKCTVKSYYRHRSDGEPGREIILNFTGPKFFGKGTIELQCQGKNETLQLDVKDSIDSYTVLLPPGCGVESECVAKFILRNAKREISSSVFVPAKRQWTVYIYPHSHVDIGYTNTQENVEIIHKRNLLNGIELAEKTRNYPEGARYLWNPEVLWPVERYLKTATPVERDYIIDAVRKGYLHLDAGYIHTNTTASADEELFEYFGQCSKMEKLTGKKIETLVQVDIPGMSWGIVPVAAKLGIKYCLAMNNGSDRVGLSTDLSFKPFWWLGPDGKSKILFLQPGSYNPGALYKGFAYWPLMAGQTDPSKLIQIVKTDHPRDNFIDKYLDDKLPMLEKSDYYPYDIFAMTWAMADNTPIDADLPEAVKSWNEDYAFPHLIISSATQIMQAFEQKYGDQLPTLSGDFTEYWSDGLGTAARQTAMNRASKERLIQVEALWTMINNGIAPPCTEIEEAWRNVILGTEHTWCYMDPSKQPITDDILNVKFGYFRKGEDMSKSLLTSALSSVNEYGSKVIGVFNSLSWKRGGLIYLSQEQSKNINSVADERGKLIPSQRLSSGEFVFMAEDVPSFGSKNYILKEKRTKSGGAIAQGNILDNGILRAVVDTGTGDISSLTMGAYEFVDSKAESSVNSFRYLHGEDDPVKATRPSNIKLIVKENGPLLATIEVRSDAEGCNSLVREFTLIAGQPQVEIKNTIDKKAVLEKEGIHFGFGFNIQKPVTRFDIPWGIAELEKDQLSAANRNWIAFQRWLDISGKEHGITFCSLDAPVFESGAMTANVLGAATNSARWIRKLEPSGTIYSWALNNHWHTNFPLSQKGIIQYRYRILPHNSGYDAATANRFGMEQAQPLIAAPVKENMLIKTPLTLEGSDNVIINSLKSGDGGKVSEVRLRSVSDKEEKVKLNWLNGTPFSVNINDQEMKNSGKKITGEIVVPAKGFVTLDIIW